MTADRYVRDYLEDIVDASEKLAAFIEGQTFETFRENDEKVFAVIPALEVIGEAAKASWTTSGRNILTSRGGK